MTKLGEGEPDPRAIGCCLRREKEGCPSELPRWNPNLAAERKEARRKQLVNANTAARFYDFRGSCEKKFSSELRSEQGQSRARDQIPSSPSEVENNHNFRSDGENFSDGRHSNSLAIMRKLLSRRRENSIAIAIEIPLPFRR